MNVFGRSRKDDGTVPDTLRLHDARDPGRNDWLTLGGELLFETAATRHGTDHLLFNIGMIYDFDERNHLAISAGRDIDGPSEFQCYGAWIRSF